MTDPVQVDAEWERLPANACPTCGIVLDAATAWVDEAHRPDDGDLSLCFYCATPMLFVRGEDGAMRLRLPTPAEWLELRIHPQLASARLAVIATRVKEAS